MPEAHECHHLARTARTTVVVSTVEEEPLMPPAPSEEELSEAHADAHS